MFARLPFYKSVVSFLSYHRSPHRRWGNSLLPHRKYTLLPYQVTLRTSIQILTKYGMCVCVWVCKRIIHIYIYVYTHTHTTTCMHTYISTYILTYTRARARAHTHTHTHAHLQTYVSVYTSTHTYQNTHLCYCNCCVWRYIAYKMYKNTG